MTNMNLEKITPQAKPKLESAPKSEFFDKQQAEQIDQEFKADFLATVRQGGAESYMKVLKFAKELEQKYGRENLNASSYYHVIIGSTLWPGLKLENNKEIETDIKDFVDDLKKAS